MTRFVELQCRSYYSFLEGASSLEALVARAQTLSMPALGVTDRNALYGASTYYRLCIQAKIHPIIGAQISLVGGDEIVLLCKNMDGYRGLSQLITEGQRDRPKGEAEASLKQLARHSDGLICLLGCKDSLLWKSLQKDAAAPYLEIFGKEALYLALTDHREENDRAICERLRCLAKELDLSCVATNAPRYALREEGPLFDVLCCIKEGVTLSGSHHIVPANHNRYLKGAQEMALLFSEEELAMSERIAAQCLLDLDFSCYRFPKVTTEAGETTHSQLRQVCYQRLSRRYAQPDEKVYERLSEELALIEKLDLSGYFLIVCDIVDYAKSRNIPAQGRGSAANSLVAYVLGITPVDPIAHNLFLGRFLHDEMTAIPDIDLDFAASRNSGLPDREEVIQYVYERFGRDCVAMVATFVTFQGRLAIRSVGKVFELPEELIDRMAKLAGHRVHRSLEELHTLDEFAPFLQSEVGKQFTKLVASIADLPRHLSIHVGGMLIASRPISELVPLEPARMEGRIVCQWDKDMVEDAGLIKVDILGLGMLAALRDALDLIPGKNLKLDQIPAEDPAVYEMIGAADTVGIFQVESRAQMQCLPRTRPRSLPELGIQVAMIRPGPIQGGMVNAYMRRLDGKERITYLHPCVEPYLSETLGVILFQEQVLQIAVAMAGFSRAQAAHLRRAMSRKRSKQAMQQIRQRFIDGAMQRGVTASQAEETFHLIEGFASYGFCKSHALSFAQIAYWSAYLKRYHPAPFLAALLSNQPMGFYSPGVLIEDAKRHGVRVLPVDINQSRSRACLEEGAVRLGLQMVASVSSAAAQVIEESQPFRSVQDFITRTKLPEKTTEQLITAGAFDSLTIQRRSSYWSLWSGESADFVQEQLVIPTLPNLSEWERACHTYARLGYAPQGHPLSFLRSSLLAQGCEDSRALEDGCVGRQFRLVALQVIRQRPPTAGGYVFLTLEDEFGLINVVIPPDVYGLHKVLIKTSGLLGCFGEKTVRGGVTNVRALAFFAVRLGT